MKYKFTKIDDDTTLLEYKEKHFEIKRDIDLQVKIQSAISKARVLMSAELTKMGMTKKDLVIEKHENGKTYYDNTNYIDTEEQYKLVATLEVYDEIITKYCGMKFQELLEDIGINIADTTPEGEKFMLELTSALMGKNLSPRQEDK
jgi:hypothetical protein